MGEWMKNAATLLGVARAQFVGAETELLLDRCAKLGLPLWKIRREDACTVCAAVWERDLPALRVAAADCRCELNVLRIQGGSRNRALLRRRIVLLIALLVVAVLLVVSSFFIWEIEVRGCEKLSRGQVLRALADCGVERGSFWPALSQDLVRSQMLTELPELGWMTVNVSGSRAMVLIQERQEKPKIYREDQAADVCAGASGILKKMTVLNGIPRVQPGDAVLAGEILVSGTVESLSDGVRHVRAAAEAQADTWHELTAACPLETLQIYEHHGGKNRFALQIGKTRINFWLFGEKGLDECDKIVHEYNLGIEGLFAMPVTLIREEQQSRSMSGKQAAREEEIKAALLERLQTQIDGEIVSSSFSVSRTEDLLLVTLRAACIENIAKTVEYS